MRNCKILSLPEAYKKILDGTKIEETGLDAESIQKLKLFIELVDCDILKTELCKKTGLSGSTIYLLRKMRATTRAKVADIAPAGKI